MPKTQIELARLEWLWQKARIDLGSKRGHVTYTTCITCGQTQWTSRNNIPQPEAFGWEKPLDEDDPQKIVTVSEYVDQYGHNHCNGCAFMGARHPEIAMWVSGLVQWHIYLSQRKLEEELNNVRSNIELSTEDRAGT